MYNIWYIRIHIPPIKVDGLYDDNISSVWVPSTDSIHTDACITYYYITYIHTRARIYIYILTVYMCFIRGASYKITGGEFSTRTGKRELRRRTRVINKRRSTKKNTLVYFVYPLDVY